MASAYFLGTYHYIFLQKGNFALRKQTTFFKKTLIIEASNHDKKNFSKKLKTLVNEYFTGQFSDSQSLLERLDNTLQIDKLSTEQQATLRKLLSIFFLGQLIGLPSLNSILEFHAIKSNHHQIDYRKLCKTLSNSQIHSIFSSLFERSIAEKLTELSKKDSSVWSKELVTAVVDDSIFRTWLQNVSGATKDYEHYYSKWFSGQFYSTVYGYKVVCLGFVIDGVFYPL